MRFAGIDVGRRRIGVAVSDPTGMLARPLTTIVVGAGDPVDLVAREIARLVAEEEGLSGVIVGVPRRLDGTETDTTSYVRGFIGRLEKRTAIPIVPADERLTSREAESRLAAREPDWRKRKIKLDAAAAAIILQDYLDGRAR